MRKINFVLIATVFVSLTSSVHGTELLGFWNCSGEGPGIIDGKKVNMSVSSSMEISPNGSYLENGRMVGGGIDLTARGAGSWHQSNDLLSITIKSMTISKLKINGDEVPPLLANIAAIAGISSAGETTTFRVQSGGWFRSHVFLSNPELPKLRCDQA